MTRKLLLAVLLAPTLALAQGAPRDRAAPRPPDDQAERRMRMVRTIGLAQALDLDTAQALKMDEVLRRFDDRRRVARKQAADARDALRAAAQPGSKVAAAEVDGAVARLLDARAQLQALDKEMLQAITRDLAPAQKARAALFLGSFRDRIERRIAPGPGMGPGMGPGAGAGSPQQGMMDHHGAHGMGSGMAMMRRGQGGWGTAGELDDDPPPFADED